MNSPEERNTSIVELFGEGSVSPTVELPPDVLLIEWGI